jgi:hypothetical protein
MLLGSDLLLFSNEKYVAVSLHLWDVTRQVMKKIVTLSLFYDLLSTNFFSPFLTGHSVNLA